MTHHVRLPRLVLALVATVVTALTMASLALAADESVATRSSASVTWTCTSSPCPSGPLFEGQAVDWPSAMGATNVRLGYTASRAVYAPGAAAKGWTVQVVAGSARVEAGLPQDPSLRQLATLGAGGSFVVGELAEGEVLSVQASSVFMYALAAPATPSPTVTTTSSTTSVTSTATATTTTQAPTSTTSTATTSTATTTTTTPAPSPTSSSGADASLTGSSALQTWTCTGSPCPWGPTTTDHALVWPSAMGALNVRLGYTVSAGVYAPGASVLGWTVTVTTGAARVYAGLPQGTSHRLLASLSAGGSYVVGPLGDGEVLSVQSSTAFSYALVAAPAGPTPTTTTSTPTTTTTTSTPTTTTTTSTPTPTSTTTPPPGVPEGSTASSLVTWTCTGSPCPWGPSTSDHAAVWPSAMGATSVRLGYTTSAAVYAPGTAVTGWTVSVPDGTAKVYAGLPQGSSHRLLATIATGGSHVISGLSSGEVVSVQSTSAFAWTLTEPSTGPTPTTTTTPTPTPTQQCSDPTTCDPVDWIESRWRCNLPGCTYADWVGGVISWPSWAAYEDNARSGGGSRTVYSVAGDLLYPYMGAWASGCRVEVVSGAVLIIEWKRGSDVWRETLVESGESYVIQLQPGEDSAMIETPNNVEPFSVSLQHCNPQPVAKGSA